MNLVSIKKHETLFPKNEPTFLFLGEVIPITNQRTDSHPCIEYIFGGVGRAWAGSSKHDPMTKDILESFCNYFAGCRNFPKNKKRVLGTLENDLWSMWFWGRKNAPAKQPRQHAEGFGRSRVPSNTIQQLIVQLHNGNKSVNKCE